MKLRIRLTTNNCYVIKTQDSSMGFVVLHKGDMAGGKRLSDALSAEFESANKRAVEHQGKGFNALARGALARAETAKKFQELAERAGL